MAMSVEEWTAAREQEHKQRMAEGREFVARQRRWRCAAEAGDWASADKILAEQRKAAQDNKRR
jgi:hypothetical protein